MSYRKQKTESEYDSPADHDDVTNKAPFCDVNISASFNYIRFKFGDQ